MSLILVNFGFWVGSLWGDYPGETSAKGEDYRLWSNREVWRAAHYMYQRSRSSSVGRPSSLPLGLGRRAIDQLFDGRKIRILTVVDTFTRLSPAMEVRQQFRGADVIAVLERVFREIGCPKTIRLDNGPEFVSRELDLWAFDARCHAPSAGLASRPTMPSSKA